VRRLALVFVAVLIAACSEGNVADAPSLVSTPTEGESTALASAVAIKALGCERQPVRGAGSMIIGGYVLTAAHVVSGAQSILVRPALPDASDALNAYLMAIDPVNDLALLSVPGLSLAPLRTSAAKAGDTGTAVLMRDDLAEANHLSIEKPVVVRILDIHQQNKISRPGYVVTIDIAAGDSGAVMVGADNAAVGVLYAKSREADNRAFATDMSSVGALLKSTEGVDPTRGIATGVCV
jgi:S1-C subfamily serine protease